MMTSRLNKIGIPGIAIAIFIGIMLFLSFYFFYTIGENRQAVEEQGFRKLSQLGITLKAQDDLIRTMVNNYSERIIAMVKEQDSSGKNKQEIAKEKEIKGQTNKGKAGNQKLSLYLFEKSPVTKHIIISTQKDSLKKYDSLAYKVNENIQCKISYGDFLSVFLRKDFFSDFLLISNNSIKFSSTTSDLIISGSGGNNTQGTDIFSIMQSDNAGDSSCNKLIRAGTIHKVKINGIRYNLLMVPVNLKFADNGGLIIGGLIAEDKISAWEKNLPANWIMIIIVILLFMIFSLPILKIFIAGSNEKFTRTLITMVGASIVVGVFLISMFAMEMLIESRTKADSDLNLKRLNESVQKAFLQERMEILRQLAVYNTFGRNMNPVAEDSITSLLQKDNPVYTPAYRYFKTMFWADKSGDQTFFITPYKSSSGSNVGYRKYFMTPEFYEGTVDTSKFWYNMEPIYSNTSGEWILAFSVPARDQSKDRIVAITSWMYSIKSPVLPPDYEYLLVDKTGKIWHHSDDIYNLSDNLLKECKDVNLEATLHSNVSNFLFITLHNDLYRVYIAPVRNTDLFIVTMFNPGRLRSMSAITTVAAIVFFSMIALLLSVFYLLIQIGSMRNRIVKGNHFFFDWLLPVERKKEAYAFLLVFNALWSLLLLTIAISGWINMIPVSWSLWILMLFVVVIFFVNYLVLNLPDHDHMRNGNRIKRWIVKLYAKDGFLTKVKSNIDKAINKAPVYSKNFRNLFTSFMLSWLIVSTALPCILFITRFHHEETKSYIVEQFDGIADRLNHRTDSLAAFYHENIPLKKNDSLFYIRDKKGLYFEDIWNTSLVEKSNLRTDPLEHPTPKIVHNIHYYFNKLIGYPRTSKINPLLSSISYETDSSFGILFKRLTVEYPPQNEKVSINLKKGSIPQEIITKTKGGLDIYTLFGTKWSTLFFFMLVALIFVFIHLLIRKIVHKLFDYDGLFVDVMTIHEQLHDLLSNGRNAIIITMTDVKNDALIRNDWTMVDMNDPKSGETKASEKIVLYDFEENLLHAGELTNQVAQLEKLLQKRSVVLVLSKSPDQLAESLMEKWLAGNEGAIGDKEVRAELLKSREALEYFRKIIFELPVFYVRPRPWENNNEEPLCSILKWENVINPDAKQYRTSLKLLLEKPKPADKIVIALQDAFTPRYSYIWNSLTREERFILYQVAKGAILNLNKREPVRVLFNKGILTSDERVEFTSLAFRQFILTQADLSDIELIEKQSIKTGTWSRFRLPLLLLATSIIVFLFATQQNVLSNLNAIVLSVATLLGVYLKFSGLLVKENK